MCNDSSWHGPHCRGTKALWLGFSILTSLIWFADHAYEWGLRRRQSLGSKIYDPVSSKRSSPLCSATLRLVTAGRKDYSCVAGGLRRLDRQNTEDKVLLRALRDFNLGKLVADDVGIFTGMLNDLFPRSLDLVPRNRDLKFEEKLVEACIALNLQAEDIFVLKCTQLREILVVRWSVFVLGPAGELTNCHFEEK